MATQRELQAYVAQKVYEHASEIARELVDYIGGDSTEEIDISVAKVIRATTSLVANISGSFQESVREGWSSGAPQTEAELAAMINQMPLDQWQQYRAQLGLAR